MPKDAAIDELVAFLRDRIGPTFRLVDHWDDPRAIGIARIDEPRVLAYVAIYGGPDDLYVELEGPPPPDDDFPYTPIAQHEGIDRTRLCDLIRDHLAIPRS